MSLNFDNRDEFNRRPVAEKIIKLLASEVAVSPMVIDGSWGTGKTEFCLKLIDLVDSSEPKAFMPIYVDAFKADHADQPLMTLLAAVLEKLPEGDTKITLKQKAIPLLRFGMKTAGKAALSWFLKANADDLAEGMQDELKSAGNNAIDHSVEALLDDHIEADKNLQALRIALAKVASEQPIVLFVDELDRCRPDFAVALLEIIKHIFDVEGVKFVLVTNTQQLKAAINHSYGSDVDAQRYLDKFLGFNVKLPLHYGNVYNMRNASVDHFISLLNNSPLIQQVTKTKLMRNGVFKAFEELISLKPLSLREVETLVKHMAVHDLINDGYHRNLIANIFCTYLYCFAPTIATKLQQGKIDFSDYARLFGISRLTGERPTSMLHLFMYLIAQLSASVDQISDPIEIEIEQRQLWDQGIESFFSDMFSLSKEEKFSALRESMSQLMLQEVK